jgi:hypothetical protein
MRAIELPARVRLVTLLVDGDDAGGKRRRVAADRFTAHGRACRLWRAGRIDFADLKPWRRTSRRVDRVVPTSWPRNGSMPCASG